MDIKVPNDNDKEKKLSHLWTKMEGKKKSLMNRCEDYSTWTLPYIFSREYTGDRELQNALDSIGARSVNHLSNKIVLTLFRPEAPFFRLDVNDDDLVELRKAAEEEQDKDAIEFLNTLDSRMVEVEKQAMQEIDYNRYRTEATMAAKNLIVTGNALMYHPPNGDPVQTYSLRDYCITRDLSGNVTHILTRDVKALSTFSEEVQKKIKDFRGGQNRNKKPDSDVKLYTEIKRQGDGRYKLRQMADDVDLDSDGDWTREDLPWIPLTWNLIRGEDYGRGLVEDYAGSFHALYVLNQAFVDAVGIAADIKWLVNPASVLDVKNLNDSPSGSYHQGKDGDIVAVQLNKQMDLALVLQAIERFERQIAQAFLLNSAQTRDAERVTAEEIRANINELELSNGGIYSRLADEWQKVLAQLILKRMNISLGEKISIKIITGLESLSRAGDLDNIRLWVNDMALLEGVPEEIRAVIDPLLFAKYLAVRRSVEATAFLKSREMMQGEQQQAMAREQQLIQAQGNEEVRTEAGKQAVRGD